MRTVRISIIALGVAVTASSFGLFKVQAADESPTVLATLNKYAQTPQLAPALEEIVKLTKSGVSEPVTLAYIQTSPTAYSLDSQDILQLQQQGVSAPVMTALIQHGEELRRASIEAGKQTQTVATATTPSVPSTAPAATAAPTVDYVPATAYPSSSVSVTYIGYPSYSYYSGYYGYGYGGACYPSYYSYAPRYYGYGYCGPRVGFGVGYGRGYVGYARGYYGGYGRHR
jgi:hypothetical protein